MSRAKYPRPEVYLWKGKSGVKLWKAEWHGEAGKHYARTWPCRDFSKKEAQAALDELVRAGSEETAPAVKGLSVERFWEEIYWPTKSLRIQPNTRHAYKGAWNCHIRPTIGALLLSLVNKAAVDDVLNRMARTGLSESTVSNALYAMKGMFEEALENDYIPKDPTRKVVVPLAKPGVPTRALTEDEVGSLFEGLKGKDYIFWRTLSLSGCRVSEVLALGKRDVVNNSEVTAIKVVKSAYNGKASTTKNRKPRLVPIPARLAKEISEYAAGVEGDLLFPNTAGNMMQRSGHVIREMLKRARAVSGIKDLTFRQCRTTLATLWDGDYKDLQEAMGHQSVDVTMGSYRKAQLERQQRTVERLEARFTGKVVRIGKRGR